MNFHKNEFYQNQTTKIAGNKVLRKDDRFQQSLDVMKKMANQHVESGVPKENNMIQRRKIDVLRDIARKK